MVGWRQTMDSDERHDLSHRDEKRNRIDETEQPQNDKPRQPIIISAGEKLFEEFFVRHRR
jgi:hypothetical protein